MLRTTIFPMRNLHVKPAFRGVERDLKDVLEMMDNVWQGVPNAAGSEFKETDQAYFLSIDLPGVGKDSLDINVEEETLFINGIRKRAMLEGDKQEQKISRSFVLPKEADKEKIEARYEDGVLYLSIPKVEKAKPKRIEIKAQSQITQ